MISDTITFAPPGGERLADGLAKPGATSGYDADLSFESRHGSLVAAGTSEGPKLRLRILERHRRRLPLCGLCGFVSNSASQARADIGPGLGVAIRSVGVRHKTNVRPGRLSASPIDASVIPRRHGTLVPAFASSVLTTAAPQLCKSQVQRAA